MISIKKRIQCFVLLSAAGCMIAIPALAQSGAQSQSEALQQPKPQSTFTESTVRHVQKELKTNGYYHGQIDGVAGPDTNTAIRAYQKDHNLAVNGRLNSAMVKKLSARSAMQNMGEAVRTANDPLANISDSSEEFVG